ncbi:MAG TPA: L,D-transpeptidase family protein [bacterium]|nr:L,D-transpeptidase family protein [bacterium]
MLAALGIILAFIISSVPASARDRVAEARAKKGDLLKQKVKDAGLAYPPYQVFIRHFKLEHELEVWGRNRAAPEFRKIASYPVCASSGTLGPKRREGDGQVPEGVYKIVTFNPWSSYHMSLGLNYPNASDRILADHAHPGGDVFIHGNCVTIGCIPIQDGPIEELYILALDSKQKSGRAPAVHLFPCRMSEPTCRATLNAFSSRFPELGPFWQDLEKIYSRFEQDHTLPQVRVDGKGRYVIR